LSVLNDCKYCHDIRDNVIRISLLRAPTLPDPEADQGEQRFAYSILPHAGGWDSPTVAAAYGLNDPLIATLTARGDAAAAATPLVQVDRENVVIETVKRAEDGNGLIVRLYEFKRMRGPVRITAGIPLAGAQRVNLLEETQAELAVDGNSVEYAIRPFEIATLRLIPA
jgi:alpha-mannosidase